MSDLGDMLTEMAVHELRRTADELDKLRERLGKDQLSMEEWNALVSAAFEHRIEASRQERDWDICKVFMADRDRAAHQARRWRRRARRAERQR